MATILFPSPIFGPVQSRRLGVSLGVNLLPSDGKWCSFDCIYCECGRNADRRTKSKLPTRSEVSSALETKLQEMQQTGVLPDVITFAGNGEPTMHPDFAPIIEDTLTLRDRYAPLAKVSVLSNATQLHRPTVFEALKRVDNNIQKLDTINENYIKEVDRPNGNYQIEKVIAKLKAFEGHVAIQTMFMKGEYNGLNVDNTTDTFVQPWLAAVKEIAPSQVMIYTIDRETPEKGLQKATHEELDRIAGLIRKEGVEVSVSY